MRLNPVAKILNSVAEIPNPVAKVSVGASRKGDGKLVISTGC